MSILFEPKRLGKIEIRNRFVHSACEDNLADKNGMVTEAMVKRYRLLASGEIGLIISSHLFVDPLGQNNIYQAGIHRDAMIPGLKKLCAAVHQRDGKIILQLGHGGLQASSALIGQEPLGPLNMTEEAIGETVRRFREASERAVEAGADGVQLHGAHGYLLNEFLSPFYNQRQDAWGGSVRKQFRFLNEVVSSLRRVLPKDRLLLVKLNTNDYTRQPGMTHSLATTYAGWLAETGVDGLEISCGTSRYSPWNMCRGDVPVVEILGGLPEGIRESARVKLSALVGQFDLEEGYNLEAAKAIKPVLGEIPLMTVGGWRTVKKMEEAVAQGYTDFIALCRPFIREPFLVKMIREGRRSSARCQNCNRCLAALPNNLPVRCYVHGFPKKSLERF